MQTSVPPESARRRVRLAVGGGVVVLALAGLVGFALTRPGATHYYVKVSELADAEASAPAEEVRVSGYLVRGSERAEGLTTTFDITDGRRRLTVTTDEQLPDAFYSRTGRIEIIAQGSYDGDVFTASRVFAKCPSKFKAKA